MAGERVAFTDGGVFPARIERHGRDELYVRAWAFEGWMFVMPDGNVHIEPFRYRSEDEARRAVANRLSLVERLRSEGVPVQQ